MIELPEHMPPHHAGSKKSNHQSNRAACTAEHGGKDGNAQKRHRACEKARKPHGALASEQAGG